MNICVCLLMYILLMYIYTSTYSLISVYLTA